MTATIKKRGTNGRQDDAEQVVALLYDHIDLSSLAALSELNREWKAAVSEDYFQAKLAPNLTKCDLARDSWRARAKAYLASGSDGLQPYNWPIHRDKLLPADFYRFTRPEPSTFHQRFRWREKDVANHGYYVQNRERDHYHYVNLSSEQPDEELEYTHDNIDDEGVLSRCGIDVQFDYLFNYMDRCIYASTPDVIANLQQEDIFPSTGGERVRISIKYKNGDNHDNLDPDVVFWATGHKSATPRGSWSSHIFTVHVVSGDILIMVHSTYATRKRRHRTEKMANKDAAEKEDNLEVYKVVGYSLEHIDSAHTRDAPSGILYYEGTLWQVVIIDDIVQVDEFGSTDRLLCEDDPERQLYNKLSQDYRYPQYATVEFPTFGSAKCRRGLAALVDLRKRRIMNMPPPDDSELLRMVGISNGQPAVWEFTREFRKQVILSRLAHVDDVEWIV